MNSEILLQIAEPCHQSRQQMSPPEQGRFCSSSLKKLVDFSRKTDEQILARLMKTPGTGRSRFSQSQLQRPSDPRRQLAYNRYKLLLALLIPAFVLNGFVTAQVKVGVKLPQNPTSGTEQLILGNVTFQPVGKPVPDQPTKPITTVSGIVTNQVGEPIPSAPVWVTNTQNGTTTDLNGRFQLKLWKEEVSVPVSASAIGCNTIEQQVRAYKGSTEIVFKLTNQPLLLCICDFGVKKRRRTTLKGGVAVVKTPAPGDSIKTMAARLNDKQMFAVYPNPTRAGGLLKVMFKMPGKYSFRLFNTAGQPFFSKEMIVTDEQRIRDMLVPGTIPKGTYYLQSSSVETGKSYTRKVVVQ